MTRGLPIMAAWTAPSHWRFRARATQRWNVVRGRLTALATAILMVVAFATPASAITNGRPDSDDHPYVGLIVSFDAQDNVKVCSGTLIDSDVALTAGHCLDGMEISFVFFMKKVDMGSIEGAIPGTPYVHPKYGMSPYKGKGLPSYAHRDVGDVFMASPTSHGSPRTFATGNLDVHGISPDSNGQVADGLVAW